MVDWSVVISVIFIQRIHSGCVLSLQQILSIVKFIKLFDFLTLEMQSLQGQRYIDKGQR